MLLITLAAGLAHAAPQAPKEAPVEVVSAEFGVFVDGPRKALILEPTDVIPLKEGQRYGWIIEVRTKRRSLSVREEYLLPSAAQAQESDDLSRKSRVIPLDRRSQVSQRQLVPVGGMIYGEWSIGAGEPPGPRRLEVIIEGKPGASFEYEVK